MIAIDLYRREVVTLGKAAKLADMQLGDFIDLCGKLRISVLWDPEGDIGSDIDAFATLLKEVEPATDR